MYSRCDGHADDTVPCLANTSGMERTTLTRLTNGHAAAVPWLASLAANQDGYVPVRDLPLLHEEICERQRDPP
jgi:hypothetical protein